MADNNAIIERQLNTLLNSMADAHDQTLQLKEQVQRLQTQYEQDRVAAMSGGKTQQEAFALYQQAFASALPGMTKGTISAIAAFQQRPLMPSRAAQRSWTSARAWRLRWAACPRPAALRAPCLEPCSPRSR